MWVTTRFKWGDDPTTGSGRRPRALKTAPFVSARRWGSRHG
jgi:hypothetical protein